MGGEQRGLSRPDAAAYCGLTPAAFDDWVRRGLVPPAIPGTHRWDRKAIDAALDKASGLLPTSLSAYDKWKAGKHANAS